MDRFSCWSVTINNPTAADDECIALARQKGWKVEGQQECVGTPHYQLMVRTGQVRFSALKKAFPRAHIEPARNSAALAAYVVKEESRTGSLPTTSDLYPSLDKMWTLICSRLSQKNWVDDELYEDLHAPSVWYKDAPSKDALRNFDLIVLELIDEGYRIETIAANPQTRSSWLKFHRALIRRSYADSQTDRQRVLEAVLEIPAVDIKHDCPPPPPPPSSYSS